MIDSISKQDGASVLCFMWLQSWSPDLLLYGDFHSGLGHAPSHDLSTLIVKYNLNLRRSFACLTPPMNMSTIHTQF